MGYTSNSFSTNNRLGSGFRNEETDYSSSRPARTYYSSSSSPNSVQFYSSFFLQRQTGNKLPFLNNFADRAIIREKKNRHILDMEDTTNREIDKDDFALPENSSEDFITYDDITSSVPSIISQPTPDTDNIGVRNVVGNSTIMQFFENVVNQTSSNNVTLQQDLDYDSSEVLKTILTYENGTTPNNSVFGLYGKLDIPEYAVFGGVLLLSAAIGVFYGCFGKGQKSTAEYLIANRQMSTIPAALSLLCSFVSAITILGNPLEIYFYGSSYALIMVTFVPLTLTLSYFYVPVFFNLQLTSAYEYFELRFNRTVRTVISLVGILHYIVYLSIVVYGPSLAIGQVTGISTRMSTAVIFAVCIFYSTLGGLKGIIATDALQAIIMIGSLVTIVYKGTQDMGGVVAVWSTAERYERTNFLNLDLDPRTRHTLWTAIIGGYFQWLPNFAATHSQIQRYISMPSLTSIRRALALNLIGLTLIFGLCYWTGLILFAMFHDCDPVQTGAVSRPDQLLPLFVMKSMGKYPGLVGLFVSGLCCASLSTVSTGLNALSAICTYDYLRNWMPLLSDTTLLKFSKALCILFGLISFGFMFVAENLGNILPAAFSLSGVVVGPTLGVFTLGMFFPFCNGKGSLLGLLSAFFIMITLVVGNQLAVFEKLIPDQTLAGLSTGGCPITDIADNFLQSTADIYSNISRNQSFLLTPERQIGHLEELGNEFVVALFSISYMWYPGLGCGLTVLFGIIFSIIGSCNNVVPVCPDHLSPPMLWLWVKLFPTYALKWIDLAIEDYPMISALSSHSATLSLQSSDFSFRKESVCDMKLKRISILPRQIQFPHPRQTQPPNSLGTDSLS